MNRERHGCASVHFGYVKGELYKREFRQETRSVGLLVVSVVCDNVEAQWVQK